MEIEVSVAIGDASADAVILRIVLLDLASEHYDSARLLYHAHLSCSKRELHCLGHVAHADIAFRNSALLESLDSTLEQRTCNLFVSVRHDYADTGICNVRGVLRDGIRFHIS